MKKLLFVALLLAWTLNAQFNPGTATFTAAILKPAAAGGGATYLVSEDCEGTGTPASWTDFGTPVDWDYSDGSTQWLRVNDDLAYSTSPTFASTTDLWVYCKVRIGTAIDANGYFIFLVGPNIEIQIFGASSDALRVSGSVNSPTTTDVWSPDTTYEVWVHYIAGSGANARCSVAFSTDGTKPTSGNKFTEFTTGTETGGVTAVRFGSVTGAAQDMRFDKMRVDDADIGTSPP